MTQDILDPTAAVKEAERRSTEASLEVRGILERARVVVILTDEDLIHAADELRRLKGRRDQVEELRVDLKRPVLDAGRNIDAKFQPILAGYDESIGAYKKAIGAYETEKRRQAEEEENRLRAAAERERARLEAQAAKAEARGDTSRADDLAMQAAMVPAPIVAAQVPKTSGVVTRDHWSAEVTSLKELAAAVAAGTVPVEALQPNMAFLNANVRAMKAAFRWPGVRAVRSTTVAAQGVRS